MQAGGCPPSTGLPSSVLCPWWVGRDASPARRCGAEEPAGSSGGERHWAGIWAALRGAGRLCPHSSSWGSTHALGTPGCPFPWPPGCSEARETTWGLWVRLGLGSSPTAHAWLLGATWACAGQEGCPALPSASKPLPAPAGTCQEGQGPAGAWHGLVQARLRWGQLLLPMSTARASQQGCKAVPSCAQRAPSPPHVLPSPSRFHQAWVPWPWCHWGCHSPSPKGLPGPQCPSLGTPCWAGACENPWPYQRCQGEHQPRCPPHARLLWQGANGPRGRGD